MTRYEERSRRYFEWGGCEKSASISMKRLRLGSAKRGRTGLSSSSLVESLAIRQRQPVHARKKHDKASSHPLAGLSSTLMTHRQSCRRINCLLRSRHRCGRRVRSEYGADLEISSSMIVSRVLLGSTVDQVSAVSPALNLTPSMSMVLTVARRRRRSANGAFLFGLCAILGGRGCVDWVVIGQESDPG